MAFYATEETSIENDQEDNELLKQFAQNYKQLKKDYESSKLETQQLKNQIVKLQQCNAQLLKELEFLQDSQQNLNCAGKQRIAFSSKPLEKGYLSMPLSNGFLKESNVGLQHTKRRIINGFVQQINSDLQLNDELLRRERKMLEDTRRSLSQSIQELNTLKANLRQTEGQLSILNCENRQLRIQIETQRKMNGQAWMGGMRKSKVGYEWDLELRNMDEIYHNIERELTFDLI